MQIVISGGDLTTHRQRKFFARPPWQECLVISLLVCGPLSRGFVTGYNSSSSTYFQHDVPLLTSSTAVSLYSSFVYVGGIISALVFGVTMDSLGRRATIFFSAFPLYVGWMLLVAADSAALLLCGRLFSGIGCSVVFSALGVYIAEVAHESTRGGWTILSELLISVGSTAAFALSDWMPVRWMAVVGAAMAVVQATLLLGVPESPRWLVEHGRPAEARRNLAWVRGVGGGRRTTADDESTSAVDEELATIRRKLDETSSTTDARRVHGFCGRFAVLWTVRNRLRISVPMVSFQGLCGHVGIVAFMNTVLADIGDYPASVAIIVGVARCAATLVASVCVERCGRKKLFVYGGAAQAVCLLLVAGAFLLREKLPTAAADDDDPAAAGWRLLTTVERTISLVAIIVFMMAYSFGWGAVPGVINSEMFPQSVRGTATCLNTIVGLTAGVVCSYAFLPMIVHLGTGGAFGTFGAVCAAGTLFGAVAIKETKGLTLEQITEMFNEDRTKLFPRGGGYLDLDRKSTRLNSSHRL